MATNTEPATRTAAILDGVTAHARPLILGEFRADSCIASTLVTIEVLKYFGITAEPLALSVIVFNAEAAQMLTDGATMDDVGEATRKISLNAEGGPWTIGVGSGQQTRRPGEPLGWAGHLIATIPDLKVIVDNSIDQISRPHKQLTFTPMWTRVPDDRWWDGTEDVAHFSTPEGAAIFLDRRAVDPDGYKASTNWDLKGPHKGPLKSIIGGTIRAIRADLDRAAL